MNTANDKLAKLATPQVTWATKVDSKGIAALNEISHDIAAHSNRMAEDAIAIGLLLLTARKMFPGDKEFGQWRKERTTIGSTRMATAFMAAADKFAGKPIVKLTSFSVLQELTRADDETISKVESDLSSGAKVTKADARKAVKDAKSAQQPAAAQDKKAKAEKEAEAQRAAAKAKTDSVIAQMDHAREQAADQSGMPEGDFEMVALTEDEIALIVRLLRANGDTDLADRIE